jgi:hypothetical protein
MPRVPGFDRLWDWALEHRGGTEAVSGMVSLEVGSERGDRAGVSTARELVLPDHEANCVGGGLEPFGLEGRLLRRSCR